MTDNNISIANKVCKVLNESPYVRITMSLTMSCGLINTRANARYILKERKFGAAVDAV